MLIASPRHTQDDLELWSNLRDADLLHYDENKLNQKVIVAKEIIRCFVSSEPAVVMTSWGKDATVVVHLALSDGIKLPIVHIAQPANDFTGECEVVADMVMSSFADVRYERIESWPNGSVFKEGKPTPELLAGSDASAAIFGTRRWVNGLRRDEKGGRQFRKQAICGISCSPIFDWSTADVYSYLAYHDVPTHPRYAMLGGGRWQRERVRVCTFGGYRGSAGGRREWELEYYGDVLRRIESESRKREETS